MKYKNKDGIELAYEGHKKNTAVQLVKSVIREAIRIGDSNNSINSWPKVRRFLIDNFSVGDKDGT